MYLPTAKDREAFRFAITMLRFEFAHNGDVLLHFLQPMQMRLQKILRKRGDKAKEQNKIM